MLRKSVEIDMHQGAIYHDRFVIVVGLESDKRPSCLMLQLGKRRNSKEPNLVDFAVEGFMAELHEL